MRRALSLLAALVLGACARPAGEGATAAAGPLLPGLAKQLPTIEAIELRTAGDRVAVTLARGASGWVVHERGDWPADAARVRTLLDDLAQAQRVEAKTTKPDRFARIGVEPVAAADATGIEVRLHGKDWNDAVVVGAKPPAGDGRFVRVSAQAQSWQVDRELEVPREPAAWLDTRLLDVPLARIVTVHSKDAAGHEFSVSPRDDRFRVTDAPSAAMGDSYRGDTLAGVLTDLRFEDVAADDGAAAERTIYFTRTDWRIVRIEAWRVDGRVWTRLRQCRPSLPHSHEEDCDESGPWVGRRFLLPSFVAAKLWLTRDQILGKKP